ncbi:MULTISPECIES: glucose 1-dehydrogenase [Fusobacterium]|uniref:Glucose 1-dehydrogenase n=1 Tax=Fusobacterium hominis TaxID=2764326 RepID=A0A7G9GU93_9FUSO|nr:MULTISPECIES: glucose 1-dehydrogenase [Fusobacterium]QNM14375.1 glucose 1-dehydrogenase [Fusobacterium hominis]
MSIKEMYDLTGKVAIVTGAGSGIGKASALKLAEAGADVVCADLDEKNALETVKEIEALGKRGLVVKCNVTVEQDLINLVDTTVKTFGKINILVNVAGGGGAGREEISTLTLEYIVKTFTLNVFSMIMLIKLCAPHMKAAKYGSIINISSMAADMVSHDMIIYGSSKASVNQMTKYAAFDLGPEIRVNAIGPGAIKTHALATVLTPEIEKKMLAKTPLDRLGAPDDIAMGVLYFASPASGWTNGQVMYINGGGIQELD